MTILELILPFVLVIVLLAIDERRSMRKRRQDCDEIVKYCHDIQVTLQSQSEELDRLRKP